MLLVVDASVVVQALMAGSLGPLTGHDLIAPPLLPSEVTSTFSEMAFRGELPASAAEAAVAGVADLPITLERPDDHHVTAWHIARSLGWAKTYDAEYVAIARDRSCPLLTLDERLRRRVGHLVEAPSLHDLTQRRG